MAARAAVQPRAGRRAKPIEAKLDGGRPSSGAARPTRRAAASGDAAGRPGSRRPSSISISTCSAAARTAITCSTVSSRSPISATGSPPEPAASLAPRSHGPFAAGLSARREQSRAARRAALAARCRPRAGRGADPGQAPAGRVRHRRRLERCGGGAARAARCGRCRSMTRLRDLAPARRRRAGLPRAARLVARRHRRGVVPAPRCRRPRWCWSIPDRAADRVRLRAPGGDSPLAAASRRRRAMPPIWRRLRRRNDLTEAAIGLVPVIGDVLALLAASPGRCSRA